MNIIYRLYFALPNFAKIGLVGKIINRLLAMVIKRIFDRIVPPYLIKTAEKSGVGINLSPGETLYIVSLTSFPARIDTVWITIETILRQSFKPDKIILWLAESQFPDKKIPDNLTSLIKRGLTIEFCKEDLKSHKKYFYAFEKYPDDFIITLDDDLYYDEHLLENLIRIHRQFPSAIATNRAHKIKFKNNAILPYRKWQHNVTDIQPHHSLVQTGGVGTIYRKADLYKDFNDIDLIRELAFHADDLWLKMMVFLNDKKVVTNTRYNKDPITVKTSQTEKLVKLNVLQKGNDDQFNKLVSFYKVEAAKLKD